MNNDQIPVWAAAMEARLGSRFDRMGMRLDALETLLNGLETREEADPRVLHLVGEITKAINESEARLMRRLDKLRNEIAR